MSSNFHLGLFLRARDMIPKMLLAQAAVLSPDVATTCKSTAWLPALGRLRRQALQGS